MLEKVDLTKKLSKEEYKEKMPQLEARLGRLQRECKVLGIPIMIVFEGFGASGKGLQIGRLIQSMDPRGFEVHPIKMRQRRKECTRSCGASGQRLRQREGLRSMTGAGIEESLSTVLRNERKIRSWQMYSIPLILLKNSLRRTEL